jgi:hypothetical protein
VVAGILAGVEFVKRQILVHRYLESRLVQANRDAEGVQVSTDHESAPKALLGDFLHPEFFAQEMAGDMAHVEREVPRAFAQLFSLPSCDRLSSTGFGAPAIRIQEPQLLRHKMAKP